MLKKVKVVYYSICKWSFKIKWLTQKCPFGYCKSNVRLIIKIHMSTNSENMVKIGPVYLNVNFCLIVNVNVNQLFLVWLK